MRNIQTVINKNGALLQEYKDEFELALKRNEWEIKQLLEAIENKFSERINEMQKVQEKCSVNISEVKKMKDVAVAFTRDSEKLCSEIKITSEENKKAQTEIKDLVSKSKSNNQMSYAEALSKNERVMPEIRNLLIKPKSKQDCNQTKNDLNENVDPKELKIRNVQRKSNGVILIQRENDTERNKIKSAIEKQIGEKYEVKIPKTVCEKFVISRMNFKHSDEKIIEILSKQNDCIAEGKVKVLKQYETKTRNVVYYNAIIETDPETFQRVIAAEKLNVGWEKCQVYDGLEVQQCFKCRGFNHKAAECKNEEVCVKCLERHALKDCKLEIISKCINCIRAKERLNIDVDINHMTISKTCPLYVNKLEAKRRKRGY